jgi:hypothetical protein
LAATAEILRANAQATLNAAGATQSAALTQDAIQQTQVSALATNQQNQDVIAAGTQTAVANTIATRTQAAHSTSEAYVAVQAEQAKMPITFLWMCCLPLFAVLLAGLLLWGVWRALRIQQANQRISAPVEQLPLYTHRETKAAQYFDGVAHDSQPQLTQPDDQVREWFDEVKSDLLNSDKKEEDDGTES